MKLLNFKYAKHRTIEAKFDNFPYTTVIFRPINQYFFVYNTRWSNLDEIITKESLEEMEWLLNKALGTDVEYTKRKSNRELFVT